jgi:serine/threonine protein kinase
MKKLGEGTYGTVHKYLDTSTNEFVAIKKIKLDSECEGIPQNILREIAILSRLSHRNIVKLIDVDYRPFENQLRLIMEYVDMDLYSYLKRNSSTLTIHTVKPILF